MENVLISVYVPIYKVERYLEKCIDSIINQTYKNLEIILVDDGSPDNCGAICDRYAAADARIKVIHKENGGISDARNAGIAAALGEYIATIDSDDYIAPDFIEKLYSMISQTGADIAVCSFDVVGESDTPKFSDSGYTVICHDDALAGLFARIFPVNVWNKLCKRSLFDGIKYPKGMLYEDLATTYKLIDKAAKVAVTDSKKYAYVQRSSSIMGQTGYFVSKDKIVIIEEMIDYLTKNGQMTEIIFSNITDYIMNDIYKMTSTKRFVENTEYKNALNRFIDIHKTEIYSSKKISAKSKAVLFACRHFPKILQSVYSLGRKTK